MDLQRVEALLRVAHQADVAELRVEGDGWRVAIRKGTAPSPVEPAAPPPPPVPVESPPSNVTVSADLVGRFHDAEPAVTAGQAVAAGQPLGGIESMGILTPVTAPEAGEIAAALVSEGQGVQFGQPLFEIAPSPGPGEEEAPESEGIL